MLALTTRTWDWAAGSLIAEEAGALVRLPGTVDDGFGDDLLFAASPGVAEALQEALVEFGLAKL